MSMQEFQAGALCEQVKQREGIMKLLDEKDYSQTARLTETLFACTALPSVLSTNTEAEEGQQKWFTLMESAWKDYLSLMIEELSFQDGDSYIPYTEDTEFKVKVAALEAARRWSLSHNVVCVLDDASNPYIKAQKRKLEAPLDIGLMRLTVTLQEEEENMAEKRILLDLAEIPEQHQSAYSRKVDETRDSGIGSSGSVSSKSQETEEGDFLPDMSGADQPPPGDHLVDIVKHLYPDALTRTYLVPPVHFNRVPYSKHKVPGTEMEVLVLPSGDKLTQQQQIECQTDFAQQHVLHNLQQLAESTKEVMFVVSELNFKDYLNKPFYAKQTGKLPKPGNLPKELRHHGKQGDFDILVIHRQHGILVGEIKPVGRTEASQADSAVAKVIGKAVQQLDKCEVHARHMVSDVAPGLTVSKTLFLPYVSRAQLQRILDDQHNAKLQQAVCGSLGVANTAEAIQLCCCSDQLSPPASYWHVTPAVLSQLSTWWTHLMARTVDTVLTDDLYLYIVARLIGPATTICVSSPGGIRVEVRTAGQAVAELGRRLAEVIMTLQQLDLMNRNPPRVYITGPPGTGKTMVLIVQTLRWLLEGQDVQVISTDDTTWPACRMITDMVTMQLQRFLGHLTHSPTPGTLSFHQYNFTTRGDVEQAVSDLMSRVKNGTLCVVSDEANFLSSSVSGQCLHRLVSMLTQTVPSLHLWMAGIYHRDIPSSLQTVPLTVPLRSAPAVLREVQPAVDMDGSIHKYSSSGLPAPGDGQRVIRLSHSGDAHTGRWPVDCFQCGKNIATELRRLGVGCSGIGIVDSIPPLSYGDVFILTSSSELQDDIEDDAGRVTSPASAVVRGLRDDGLPVCVIGAQARTSSTARWERDMKDVAVGATDRVTVAQWSFVQGLERRVVVVLPGRDRNTDNDLSDEDIDRADRLFATSRCSTQLIFVDISRSSPPRLKSTPDSGVSWVKKKGFLL